VKEDENFLLGIQVHALEFVPNEYKDDEMMIQPHDDEL